MRLLTIILLVSSFTIVLSFDLPELSTLVSLYNFMMYNSNSTKTQMTLEELGVSRGKCTYEFRDFISFSDKDVCAKDDHYIAHLLTTNNSEGVRKPPIMVKCLQSKDNTFNYNSTLLMMKNVKDIVNLLKPIGNATKRHEPGNCVLILFYTQSSLGCAQIAPYANLLPYSFPTLQIAAIDAYRFPSFNTEFGVVGLPTLLLFHQGRPIIKFYSDATTFAEFVTRHTGIKPAKPPLNTSEITGPLPLQPVREADYILILAWCFIFLCVGYYFAKSNFCKQIIEMIKRNWRESEAQLERN